jgi:hypothetical protein
MLISQKASACKVRIGGVIAFVDVAVTVAASDTDITVATAAKHKAENREFLDAILQNSCHCRKYRTKKAGQIQNGSEFLIRKGRRYPRPSMDFQKIAKSTSLLTRADNFSLHDV